MVVFIGLLFIIPQLASMLSSLNGIRVQIPHAGPYQISWTAYAVFGILLIGTGLLIIAVKTMQRKINLASIETPPAVV
jgi:hypothetical protein